MGHLTSEAFSLALASSDKWSSKLDSGRGIEVSEDAPPCFAPLLIYWRSMDGLRRSSVRLTPYQAEWKKLYEKEATQLRTFFGEKLLCVEHVGSTAVDGMEAKPIIDMMAAVEDLEEAHSLVPAWKGLATSIEGMAVWKIGFS